MIVPAGLSDRCVDVLRQQPGTTHVAILRDAGIEPPGDVPLSDVAREAVSDVVRAVRALPGAQHCPIVLTPIDSAVSSYAERAEEEAPGLPVDAVVWEDVEATTNADAALSVSFVALLVIATLIAAVGILLDNPVLIVGAMVVGPEFGPLAGLIVAAVQRRWQLARRSLIALAVGFPLASFAALLLTLAVRATAGLPESYSGQERELTGFVAQPDAYALLVALLAGAAGVFSLTSAKSSALVGVAVSVTTVPAAADIGLSLAAGRLQECLGATQQLFLNPTAIVLAGIVTLALRRRSLGAGASRR